MSKGLNKIMIIGNLGQDPDGGKTNSGVSACRFSVATTSSWRNRNTGQLESHTEWHNVSLFDKRADAALTHLRKGSRVYIEGELRTREYQTSAGENKRITEIQVSDMTFLDGAQQQQQQQGFSQGSQQQQQQQQPPQQQGFSQQQQPPQQQYTPPPPGAEEDDIPF